MNTDFETRWGKWTEPIFSGDVIRGNQNRQVGIHPAFVIATFLHPSLKLFKSIGVDEASKARVKEVVLDLMMQNAVVTDPQPAEAVNDNEDDDAIITVEDETPLARILRLNMETEDDVVGNQSDNNRKASFERELRDYKQWKGKIPHQGGYPDALEWWKLNESRFPHLALLAKKYLSIQATSAPSERIFSKAGRIISDLRTRLNSTISGMLMYLSENWDWYDIQMRDRDE